MAARELRRLIDRAIDGLIGANLHNERHSTISLAQAVDAEIAIAAAEDSMEGKHGAMSDPIFRLHSSRWAVAC